VRGRRVEVELKRKTRSIAMYEAREVKEHAQARHAKMFDGEVAFA
jgi:hypothetical protein